LSEKFLSRKPPPSDLLIQKQIHAPNTEQKWERRNPATPPKMGPDNIGKNAVPGIPND